MTGGAPALIAAPSVNWGAFLEQVIRDYNTPPAKGLFHGLQKEAIQNSHGARDRQSKVPWSCDFRLIKSGVGELLTITDQGSFGLTGTVFPDSRNLPDILPPNERLARFESMFDSGGNSGPGLFGRGKLIFNACSQDHLIYYDTFTRDGGYRFGKRHFKGRDCEQFQRVFEGDSARARLIEETAGVLQPLTTPGTRITVVRPISEVISPLKGGEFLAAVEDTWWEIILKEKARISLVGVDGITVEARVPDSFDGLPREPKNKWRVYHIENQMVPVGDHEFKAKHLHLLLPPQGHKLTDEQLGVFVHRRGMQVGSLPLAGIPEDLSDRFFGYVQLDEPFEDAIAGCENTTHYGFSHTKRPEFRALKRWVQEHLNTFMTQIGYGPKTDPTERAKEQAEEAQAALNDILRNLGIPNIGSGPEKPESVFISIEDLSFPGDSNYLETGFTLAGFQFAIKNRSTDGKDLTVEVLTHEQTAGTLETVLPKKRIHLEAGEAKATGPLEITFRTGVYPSARKITCTATAESLDGTVLAKRSFSVWLDLKPREPDPEFAEIELIDIEFPRSDSKRVDFGQSIRGLSYRILNKSPRRMACRLNVRTIWAQEGVELDPVSRQDLTIGPYGSSELTIEEVQVSRAKYEEAGRGKIKLRCTSTALESTEEWEKGLRLAEHTTVFYLEMDPAYGLFEETSYVPLGPDKPRSKATPTAGQKSWRLDINSTHPAFQEAASNAERQVDYLFEEGARQTTFVLLRRGQYDAMRRVLELDPHMKLEDLEHEDVLAEVAYRFTDRLLAKYYG